MRRTILFLSVFLVTLSSCSTNRIVTEAFQKYKYVDGATSVTVPGWLISFGTYVADLSNEERQLIRGVDKVKVLTLDDPLLNKGVDFYDEYYQKLRSQKGYEDLLMVRDNGENVGILGRFKKDVIRELIILVGGDENTMIYLKGKLDPAAIKKMIDSGKETNIIL